MIEGSSKHHSQYHNQEDDSVRVVGEQRTGKRLRADGTKRTEEECRQMLRLAEVENKELKDSLRYVEIQLAKTRDNYSQVCHKYEESQEEITKCHEQINRQTNINHAQAQQIEEMARKMDEFVASQKEMYEKSKFKVSTYQNEIDMREEEINRLKRQLAQRDEDIQMLTGRMATMSQRMKDIEEELELKSGENNRLRNSVADLEKAVQDLYVSRKGDGSYQVELEKLKADNERLIMLLKSTTEYQDLPDSELLREAKQLANKSNLNTSGISRSRGTNLDNSRSRGKSYDNTQGTRSHSSINLSNEWIPTDAVRAIQRIKQEFNGQMTETCVSQILYELNSIWRALMRRENDAIKRKLTEQIQDLRRQLITKRAFDELEASNQISRLKKELAFAHSQNLKKKPISGAASSVSSQKENNQVVPDRRGSKAKVSESNHGLKKRITELENQRGLNSNVLNQKGDLLGIVSNSEDISSSHQRPRRSGVQEEGAQNVFRQALANQNLATNSGREGGYPHPYDNISQSFNYSDYS